MTKQNTSTEATITDETAIGFLPRVIGNLSFFNADNLEIMRGFADNEFDLAIVDPPYGIDINPNMGIKKGQKKRHNKITWDSDIPTQEYFNELFRVAKNHIIWGVIISHYHLQNTLFFGTK